jgi:3-oxoacyl-[acyl-carrier protein] reductase
VVWLASNAAGWITGADLLVDGGTRVRSAHSPADTVHERLRTRAPGA